MQNDRNGSHNTSIEQKAHSQIVDGVMFHFALGHLSSFVRHMSAGPGDEGKRRKLIVDRKHINVKNG